MLEAFVTIVRGSETGSRFRFWSIFPSVDQM